MQDRNNREDWGCRQDLPKWDLVLKRAKTGNKIAAGDVTYSINR